MSSADIDLIFVNAFREKMKDYDASKCNDDESDEWCLGIEEGIMSGPDPVRRLVIF